MLEDRIPAAAEVVDLLLLLLEDPTSDQVAVQASSAAAAVAEKDHLRWCTLTEPTRSWEVAEDEDLIRSAVAEEEEDSWTSCSRTIPSSKERVSLLGRVLDRGAAEAESWLDEGRELVGLDRVGEEVGRGFEEVGWRRRRWKGRRRKRWSWRRREEGLSERKGWIDRLL